MNTNKIYKYKVLLVEDEELLRKNYASYLNMHFSDVYEAKDGEEAYSLYKEVNPDIMIVDIHIPKINGLELLKMIREKDIETKAIILTAHITTDFLLEATSLKLIKYLKKPAKRRELKEALSLAIAEMSNFSISNVKIFDLNNGFIWNNELKELTYLNDTIALTNKEKLFLVVLFSHKDRVFSYDEIFFHVWPDYDKEASFDALKNLIKRLRKKLPINLIQNIFGEGYKIIIE